jgi:tetratricopeptide (TPR) repeat protein
VTAAAAPVTQPKAADSSDAKDSLVIQFDLPDNPAPSGAELEKEGKYQEAVAAYVDALKQNPKDTASWWALGNLYRKLHQKTYAVQSFEQILKLQPDNQKLADWLEQYKASNP